MTQRVAAACRNAVNDGYGSPMKRHLFRVTRTWSHWARACAVCLPGRRLPSAAAGVGERSDDWLGAHRARSDQSNARLPRNGRVVGESLESMLSFRRRRCPMPCLGTEVLPASVAIHIRAGDDQARAIKGGEPNMRRIRPLVATLAAAGLLGGGGAAIASAATSTSTHSAASSTATTTPAKTMPTAPAAGAKALPAGAKGSGNCPNM